MTGGVHSSSGSTTGPLRTCVGCRQRVALSDLIRVVAISGQGVPDLGRRLPGRGAHLHPAQPCLARAEQRKAFARALRVAGPLDLTPIREYIAETAGL